MRPYQAMGEHALSLHIQRSEQRSNEPTRRMILGCGGTAVDFFSRRTNHFYAD